MLDRLSSSSKETSKKPSDERTNTADTVSTNTHDDNVQPAQTTEVDMTSAEISTQTHTETSVGDMTSTESCMHTATLELETHKKKEGRKKKTTSNTSKKEGYVELASKDFTTDLGELSAVLRKLVESFEEERVAALDREKRLRMQIHELTKEIKQLTIDLNETKTKSAQNEDRLMKKLNDLKSCVMDRPNKAVVNTYASRALTSERRVPGEEHEHVRTDLQLEEKKISSNTPNLCTSTVRVNDHDPKKLQDEVPTNSNLVPELRSTTTTCDTALQLDADAEANDCKDDGNWMKKGRRLPSKLQRQQNKTENKPLGKLVGAARIRKRVYYLGGISPECSAEDIQNFCDPGCRLIECRMLPSRRYGTQAARLVVPENPEIKLESLDWPPNLYLRRWNFDTKARQAPMDHDAGGGSGRSQTDLSDASKSRLGTQPRAFQSQADAESSLRP